MVQKLPKSKAKFFIFHIILIISTLFLFIGLQKSMTFEVKTVALNVRTGPGVTYDVQTQAKNGDILTLVHEKNNWYEVKLSDGTTGWVASWLIDNNGQSALTNLAGITKTESTLYAEHNTESEQVGTVEANQSVIITLESDGWYLIDTQEYSGWTLASNIDTTKVETNTDDVDAEQDNDSNTVLYVRTDGTKIRTAANIASDVVTELNAGDTLEKIGDKNDWYEVETNDGQKGFVASWVVSQKAGDMTDRALTSTIAESTIVIDPGHGGYDAGAQTASGEYEKDITLSTAIKLATELQNLGANVILTRSDDTFIELADRPFISNRASADAFISIHYDSTEGHNVASGTTTYYYHDFSVDLANSINDQLITLPLPNRGVEFGNHEVTRENNSPAVLLELGYLNHDTDASYAISKDYQTDVAKAITNGLIDYFQISN